jgi:endogenous inhibitor of DNA gyrase (YacG/DUF329 family)
MDNRHDPKDIPPARPCPICGKPQTVPHRPFCSKRCADIDLGRWLKGVYAVPTNEPADEDGRTGEPEG